MTATCNPISDRPSPTVARGVSALPSHRLARRGAGAGRDRVRRVRAPVQRRPELPRLADLLRPRRVADRTPARPSTTPPARSVRSKSHKAWREQLHRMLAGTLGVLVLVLALLAARKRRFGIAAGRRGVACWSRSRSRCTCAGSTCAASALAIARRSDPAVRGRCAGRTSTCARAATLTLAVIIFQALLGMWTVTWLLKPIVVMGHLLGGLPTFALLAWMAWRATDSPIRLADAHGAAALGDRGAGAACGADRARRLDQRQLRGARPAPTISRNASASGGRRTISAKASCCGAASAWITKAACSTAPSRIAIQMAHRMMAVVAFAALLALAVQLAAHARAARLGGAARRCSPARRSRSASPTSSCRCRCDVAVAHNAGAALLLFVLVVAAGAAARAGGLMHMRASPSPVLGADQAARGRADRVHRAGRHVPRRARPAAAAREPCSACSASGWRRRRPRRSTT